jgi:predicted flap endonuclease-1-like 5' DNA nuclease
MTTLISIEGVGEKYTQKLKDAGVGTSEELLKTGATPKGRKDLAAKTGISEDRLLEWVNHVDLFRIRGVGEEYADLLEAAGVDTIPELAQRNAANLYAKLVEVNQVKKLVRQVPSEQMIADWIQQAGELPRVIVY